MGVVPRRILFVAAVSLLGMFHARADAEQRNLNFRKATELPAIAREVKCEVGQIEFTEDGLSIEIEQSKAADAACGISIQAPLAGDFEWTLDYSLDKITAPDAGIGAGVKLFAKTVGPKEMALTFAHLVGPDGKYYYLVMLRPNDGKNNRFQKFKAGDSRSGSLRISRVQNDLIYSVARSNDGSFEALFTTFVEPQALAGIRIVNSVSATAQSSIVLHETKLIADRFDRNFVKRAGANSDALLWFVLIAVVIAGALCWFVIQRARPRAETETASGDNNE